MPTGLGVRCSGLCSADTFADAVSPMQYEIPLRWVHREQTYATSCVRRRRKEATYMRKLLAILLMSAGLIVTTTAAFAQDGAKF